MNRFRSIREKVLSVVATSEDGKQYKCMADINCVYVQIYKFNHGNFLRHIRTQHPQKLEVIGLPSNSVNIQPTETDDENTPPIKKKRVPKVLVETNRELVFLGTLQLGTINALPYSFPDWIGFQNLVKPLWDAFNISMNKKILTELYSRAAAMVRKTISNEVKGKMLNIKIDSTSRRHHNSFGVMVQYFHDGKVVCRCLVIKEITGSQTAIKLKETIQQEVLRTYSILPEQIFTITHDNGSNMIATVARLRDTLLSEREEKAYMKEEMNAVDAIYQTTEIYRRIDLAATDEAMDDKEEIEERAHIENSLVVEQFSAGSEDDIEDDDLEYLSDESEELLLEGTRCAAHTCQLAIWDVLKSYEARITTIKILVRMTRQSKYKETFLEHKAHHAPISNATRWNAVYLMLKALREQKSFFLILENKFPELGFSKYWTFIEKLCSVLEPLFFLTVSLQHTHVPLSEFYTQWLICQAHLYAMRESSIAGKLLKAMEKRLSKLIDTVQFKAALYMDPRYNYIGSNRISISDKDAAQSYLLKLWHRLNALDGCTEQQEGTYDTENETLEGYLNNYFQKDSPCSEKDAAPSENGKLYRLLKELELRPKVPIVAPAYFKPPSSANEPTSSSTNVSIASTAKTESFDILRYWMVMQGRNPQMFRLAVVVYSAPSTQVSVERAFSALKLILTDHRQRLSDERIQDIMILKLNPELLPDVAKQLNIEIDA